jgi:hypothetical protein
MEESDCDPCSRKLNETSNPRCSEMNVEKVSPSAPRSKKLEIYMEFNEDLCASFVYGNNEQAEKQRPKSCGKNAVSCHPALKQAKTKKAKRRPRTYCSSMDLLGKNVASKTFAFETTDDEATRPRSRNQNCQSRVPSESNSCNNNCLKCGTRLLTAKSSCFSMRICLKCIDKERNQPSQGKSDNTNANCLIQKAIDCKEKRIKELCTKLKQAEEFLLRLSEERERLDEKACQLKLCRCCRSDDNQTDDAQNDEEFCRNLDAIRTVDGMIRNKIDGIKSIKQQIKELQEEIDAMKKC